jgi:hypothetical protein
MMQIFDLQFLMCFLRRTKSALFAREAGVKWLVRAANRGVFAVAVLIALVALIAPEAAAQKTPEETGVEPGTTATTPLPNAPASNSAAAAASLPRFPPDLGRLVGRTVRGPDGDDLGKVANVVFDSRDRSNWAVVECPGFLGLGTKRVLVPVDGLSPRAGTGDLRLDRTE